MMVGANSASALDDNHEKNLGQLILGCSRQFDDRYQQDELAYRWQMRCILRLLSVRTRPDLRRLILTLPLRILNRGRVEAFVSRGTIFVDIALLDLLWYFSFEQGVAQLRHDPYHMLEFTLEYAEALNNQRPFEQPDPLNQETLSDAQFRQLWEDVLHVQRIAFETTLMFILAHEIGHLVLDHEGEANKLFPNPATHRPDNASWLLWRRNVELKADRFGALLSLDALNQPAQWIPWLDLVEVRRSYYGMSVEYPTPGQRASTIWAAYAERFDRDGIERGGLPYVDPLPPDRDVSKSDRARNLDNVRQLRAFRGNFLAELDTQVGDVLSQNQDVTLAAAVFLYQVEAYRQILNGADHPETIDEALARLDEAVDGNEEAVKVLSVLFERAFSAPEPANVLLARLEQEPPDIEGVRQQLSWAKGGLQMFAEALDLEYLIANTRFRWEQEVFASILAQLPEPVRTRLRLAPHRIGEPARMRRYNLDQRVEALQRWDGSYATAVAAIASSEPGLTVVP